VVGLVVELMAAREREDALRRELLDRAPAAARESEMVERFLRVEEDLLAAVGGLQRALVDFNRAKAAGQADDPPASTLPAVLRTLELLLAEPAERAAAKNLRPERVVAAEAAEVHT